MQRKCGSQRWMAFKEARPSNVNFISVGPYSGPSCFLLVRARLHTSATLMMLMRNDYETLTMIIMIVLIALALLRVVCTSSNNNICTCATHPTQILHVRLTLSLFPFNAYLLSIGTLDLWPQQQKHNKRNLTHSLARVLPPPHTASSEVRSPTSTTSSPARLAAGDGLPSTSSWPHRRTRT